MQPEPHRSPAPAGRAGRARHLRRQHQRAALGHDPQRRRRAGPADRLRQRREPAAVARDDAAEGAVGPALARRDARAAGPAAADREPAARVRSAGRSASSSATGASSCCLAPPGQLDAARLARAAFVLAITGLTGIVFGIAPALRGTGMNVNSALKETSRGVVGSRSLLGKSLLVVQVAISLVLLVGAGLFLQNPEQPAPRGRRIQPAEPSAVPRQPAVESLRREADGRALPRHARPRSRRYRACAGSRCRRRRCCRAASTAPASTSRAAPTTSASGTANNDINRLVISPNFFDVMGIPVLSRARLHRSRPRHRRRRSWSSTRRPHGKYFPERESARPAVRHERRDQRRHGSRRRPAATSSTTASATPRRQRCMCPTCRRASAARCSRCAPPALPTSAAGAVREAVRQIDPNLPLMDVSTQIEQVEQRFMQEKLFAQAYTLFGGLALLLACDRPLRLDVLQRVAAHQRDRHPHGARRAAAGRAAPGDARVDDPRGDRRRRRPRHRARSGPPGHDAALRPAAQQT